VEIMAEDFSTWAHIVAAILVHWTVDASFTKQFNCVAIHEWWYDKAQRSLNLGKIQVVWTLLPDG